MIASRVTFLLISTNLISSAQLLTIAPGSTAPGSSVALPLSSTASGGQIAALQWTLTYSTSVVTGVSIPPGSAANKAGTSTCTITLSVASTAAVSVILSDNSSALTVLASVSAAAGLDHRNVHGNRFRRDRKCTGTITAVASASANIGVAGVQFLVDGQPAGTEVTTSPYSLSINTTHLTNGTHTISAKARDAAGNTATSTAVSVTVSNSGSVTFTPIRVNAGGPAYTDPAGQVWAADTGYIAGITY